MAHDDDIRQACMTRVFTVWCMVCYVGGYVASA